MNNEREVDSTTDLNTRFEELAQEFHLFKEITSAETKTLRNELGRFEELSEKQGKELVNISQRLATLEAEKSALHSASDSPTDRRRLVHVYESFSK